MSSSSVPSWASSQQDEALVTQHSRLLDNGCGMGCLPSLSHPCLLPLSVSWGHFPNKLLVLECLSQGQLLGEPNLRELQHHFTGGKTEVQRV